ncbi:MAG: hypothetical protein K6T26_03185 [Alicyclobacillus sp.]|nr:hypothetical protein [Alicyclobacillus sp.]
MKSDVEQLKARLRAIAWVGAAVLAATVAARWLLPWPAFINGLWLGEIGGAAAVYSMVRQGHLRSRREGAALMVSGVTGYFFRLLLLCAVILAARKLPGFSPYGALAGYLLALALLVAGLSVGGRSADR